MIYKNAGEVTVTWTDTVDAPAAGSFLDVLLSTSIADWLLPDEERATKAFAEGRSFQSTGLKGTDPAAAAERGWDHPWDKTREDIGWWWLWEEDHECW